MDHQRRLTNAMREVVKKEVIKLLDDRIIYPVPHSEWLSPIHCVPKKGGLTVVKNEKTELIPQRTVTRWRICIDYRKLNKATKKDHFPSPFIDEMLERLENHTYFSFSMGARGLCKFPFTWMINSRQCLLALMEPLHIEGCPSIYAMLRRHLFFFLDGYSGFMQIPIHLDDQDKTTFTCHYGTFAYRRMPFNLCNAPISFQRCMMAVFSEFIEEIVKVFMDDFFRLREDIRALLGKLT
jgi:hypothetical protein